jgi:hypothetical protein
MAGVDPERLPRLAEALAFLFYALMLLALICALTGSAGSGFLLLVLGSCAHVARVGSEGFVNAQSSRDNASLGRRERSTAPARRAPRPRPAIRNVASSPVAADLADLRAKLASKLSASR